MVNQTQPLLPKDALAYFDDSSDIENRLYFRAVAVRSCLENVMDSVFTHLIPENNIPLSSWSKYDLNGKIKAMRGFFSDDVVESLHRLRILGNHGAHQKYHTELKQADILEALPALGAVCEQAIFSYFRKHGFVAHRWLPTIFSTLKPSYRVSILERLFVEQKTLFIVDKLAMAYVKNNQFFESIKFIEDCYKSKILGSLQKDDLIEKMEMISKALPYLPIARNLADSKKNFEAVAATVSEDERSLFLTFLSAVLAGHGETDSEKLPQ